MSPPQLARDAPVANVVHPLVEHRDAIVRDEFDAPALDSLDSLLGKRLHPHEPLRGDQRLDNGLRPVALTDADRVFFGSCERARLLESSDNSLSCLKAVEFGVNSGFGGHTRIRSNHTNERKAVTLTYLEIVWVMAGSDLYHAGAKRLVDHLVRNDRDFTPYQRQAHGFAD